MATDAGILAELHAASWRDSYRGILRDEYLDGDVDADRRAVWSGRARTLGASCYGFVAEDKNAAIGFVFLLAVDDPVWGTRIDNIHVAPALRGKGIGRVLMEAAARETVRRHPDDPIYLWVFEQNDRARQFYARLGGVEVERMMIEVPGGGRLPEVRVTWTSPAALHANVLDGVM